MYVSLFHSTGGVCASLVIVCRNKLELLISFYVALWLNLFFVAQGLILLIVLSKLFSNHLSFAYGVWIEALQLHLLL